MIQKGRNRLPVASIYRAGPTSDVGLRTSAKTGRDRSEV